MVFAYCSSLNKQNLVLGEFSFFKTKTKKSGRIFTYRIAIFNTFDHLSPTFRNNCVLRHYVAKTYQLKIIK